jgi:hypothetical protein
MEEVRFDKILIKTIKYQMQELVQWKHNSKINKSHNLKSLLEKMGNWWHKWNYRWKTMQLMKHMKQNNLISTKNIIRMDPK